MRTEVNLTKYAAVKLRNDDIRDFSQWNFMIIGNLCSFFMNYYEFLRINKHFVATNTYLVDYLPDTQKIFKPLFLNWLHG